MYTVHLTNHDSYAYTDCPHDKRYSRAYHTYSALFMLYSPFLEQIDLVDPRFLTKEEDYDVVQAIAAVNFVVRFTADLAVEFNKNLGSHPEWLATLAPPATITCYQALEALVRLDDIIGDAGGTGFAEIYKALGMFSQRWHLGGTCSES